MLHFTSRVQTDDQDISLTQLKYLTKIPQQGSDRESVIEGETLVKAQMHRDLRIVIPPQSKMPQRQWKLKTNALKMEA